MKIILYNQKQKEIAKKYIDQLQDNVMLSIDEFKKQKTKQQLGFIFGGLFDCVTEQSKEFGLDYDGDTIKEELYKILPTIDDSFYKKVRMLNGDIIKVPLRLSQMNAEQVSEFINYTIYILENYPQFQDIRLHPSLKYCWLLRLTKDDIRQVQSQVLPRVDKEFMEYSRKQSCICCGIANRSEVHHIKEAGLTGTGYKADDWASLPLCNNCHRLYHEKGKEFIYKELKFITDIVDIENFCKMKYLRWKNKNNA